MTHAPKVSPFRSVVKPLLVAFLTLATSFAWAEAIPVVKRGDITIPAGMRLVTDRAGNRWLLTADLDEPPVREAKIQYFTTTSQPSIIRRIGTHVVLNGPKNAVDAVTSESQDDPKNVINRIPKALADLLVLEKAANIHAQQSADLQSLGVFGPAKFASFQLPYIPMPAEAFEFAEVSKDANAETKNLIQYEEGGKKFYRYFIHPNYVGSYKDLIEKYGIVYHYEALSSSSPRSVIVIDPDRPAEVHWVKVSIHRKIDGSVRINTDKKARRAIMMSEGLASIPEEQREDYGISVMLEPAALQPKGKISSTIYREVAPELLKSDENEKWIPAIILRNSGADAVPDLNMEAMIKASGKPPGDFVRDDIVRPLLKAYLNLGLREGLPGELHVQNFYYQVRKGPHGWLPTGHLMLKDNDGFRYDTELALRRGRPMEFFAKFTEPFTYGKYSNTLGLGSEGVPFLGSWYYKLIRNVKGFETLAAYTMHALQETDPQGAWNKDSIQLMFDDTAAEEAKKITGVDLNRSEYGFGFDQGINRVLNTWRAKLSIETDTKQRNDAGLQSLLRDEWTRLAAAKRVSVKRRSLPKDFYIVLHESPDHQYILEARTPRTTTPHPDPTIGFAAVEVANDAAGADFRNKLQSHRASLPKTGGNKCTTVAE